MSQRKYLLMCLGVCAAWSVTAQEMPTLLGNYTFIPNKGQWADRVVASTAINSGRLWMEQKGLLYHFYQPQEGHHHFNHPHQSTDSEIHQELIYAEFLGAQRPTEVVPLQPTGNRFGYFLGNDSSKWKSGISGFRRLTYRAIYPSIDLTFFEEEDHLKYEYHVHPGGDYRRIRIKYHGVKKIKKNRRGDVVITTELGQLTERKPKVYQIKNGRIITVESAFVLEKEGTMRFQLGDYDTSLDLIIDPVLVFATYVGSVSNNYGMTATYGYDGSAYSGGMVFGSDYPVPAPAWDTIPNITASDSTVTTDVFVSKYTADGSALIWTNFIGGGDNVQGTETAHSMICDADDNIYVYGVTSSTDFPTLNAYQTSHGGGTKLKFLKTGVDFGDQGADIYVTKISADGLTLMGSTYIGGAGNDGVNCYANPSGEYASDTSAYDSLMTNYGDPFRGEIMLDTRNNVYIASTTWSTDFPVVNGFQTANAGQQDGVIFRLSSDFSNLDWSSYFGGSENDACYSVKIDSSYHLLIAGGTCSPDLPQTAGAIYPTYQGGKADGFVAKLPLDGSAILQTSYIGTPEYDQVMFIETDRDDDVYLLGQSLGDMPVVNAAYADPNSTQYIVKLNPQLTAIEYATVFGNGEKSINISPSAFLVDVCENVYVSGWGGDIIRKIPLSGMPTTPDAFLPDSPNGYDFYLWVMKRDAEGLLFGSYLGGSSAREHVDGGTSRFDKYGVIYQSVCGGCSNCDGCGGSSDFPTSEGAWSDTNLSSNCNNLVFKIDFQLTPSANFTVSEVEGCAPFVLKLDNKSSDTSGSVWTFPSEATVISGGIHPELRLEAGVHEIVLSVTDTLCDLTDTVKKIVTVYTPLRLDIPTHDTVVCSEYAIDLWANSYGTATSFEWSDDPSFSTVLNSGAEDSVIAVLPSEATTYYVRVSNGYSPCDRIDSIVVQFAGELLDLADMDTVCYGDTLKLNASSSASLFPVSYSWEPNEGIVYAQGTEAWIVPPTSSHYYVTAVVNAECTVTDSIEVNVVAIDSSELFATADPDTIPDKGTTLLSAFPNDSSYVYTWTPATNLNASTGQTVTATIDETTTFEVAIGTQSCQFKTPVTVHVQEVICEEGAIFVPSAFSPNDDQENDVLYVRGPFLKEIDFNVFNRWGELVFHTNDRSVGWDGSYKGRPADPGVYVYHLKAVCVGDKETFIKGNTTILK